LAAVVWWLVKQYPAAGAMQQPSQHIVPANMETPVVGESVILQGAQNIWDMAFLPDGQLVFSERGGTLNVAKNGAAQQIAALTDVQAKGEGGLLGLAVDPEFTQNQFIYACFNSTAGDVRVVRWKLSAELALSARTDIITGIPSDTVVSPGRHSGCQLAFGPDGHLWVGTGDTARGDIAIQPKSLGGKILRVSRDGKAIGGNMEGDFDSRIYSYGHRNVQGLAFFSSAKHDGVSGLSIEHGSDVDDEVNELKKGNFGWAPPAQGYDESVPMTDTTRFPDAISAIWSSGNSTQAPSSGTILSGSQWKGWEGALAMTVLKDQHLKILRLDENNKVTKEERLLEKTYGRLRAIVQGPDGSLYVGSADKIIKLSAE
jgi:glucose/arabinose dehydrogenase